MKDAGIKGDEVLRAQYCHGLPLSVRSALHAMTENLTDTEKLVDATRSLLREYGKRQADERVYVNDNMAAAAIVNRRYTEQQQGETMQVCPRCGGQHSAKKCKTPKQPRLCWTCGQVGHFRRNCPALNGQKSSTAPADLPRHLEALPIVPDAVNGVQVRALIDTGCGKSIISPRFSISTTYGPLATIVTINGDRVSCQDYARVLVECSGMSARIECLVLDKLVDGVDVVLGMDAIELLGGVMITSTEIFLGTTTAIRRQFCALTSKPSCGAAF